MPRVSARKSGRSRPAAPVKAGGRKATARMAKAAPKAKRMLAIDTWFGVAPADASAREIAEGQARDRVLSSRRLVGVDCMSGWEVES